MESKIEFIRYALKNNETVVLAARCSVEYDGRAQSRLEEGDRLIIIKKDKTILIHQPEGNNPINYMKPGALHSLVFENGCWAIKSEAPSLKEYLLIKLSEIYFVNSHDLQDGQKITLVGSEKDMAEMIYKNPELIEPGFKPLSMEEHTKYGFIDVFGLDARGVLVVVECKRYVADVSAVQQLRRYVEKIKDVKQCDEVRGIIAAPKMTANALKMLRDWHFEFVEVNPPKKLMIEKSQTTLGGFYAQS
ncbi:DUF91 domain-containing protein [Candidatus Woesearchaeota archaeon]|nr:MAG: DUF91 domain-containing protein [Candidatus Woesearchaeota archaeon]